MRRLLDDNYNVNESVIDDLNLITRDFKEDFDKIIEIAVEKNISLCDLERVICNDLSFKITLKKLKLRVI